MTRVLLADDQAMVRSGLRLILELADIEVVGEAADEAEAVFGPLVARRRVRGAAAGASCCGAEASCTRSVVSVPPAVEASQFCTSTQ